MDLSPAYAAWTDLATLAARTWGEYADRLDRE